MSECKFWDEFHLRYRSPVPSIEDLQVLDYLSPTNRVLEVGFGGGQNLLALNARGYTLLHGVEISTQAIGELRAKCADIDIRMIDGGSLPYPDNYFDAIIMTAVLSTIGNFELRDTILGHIDRVTKQCGIIIICDYVLDEKKRADYLFNLSTYNYFGKFKPDWSEIPFVHYTGDCIVELFRSFAVLWRSYAPIPTLRNEEEAGIVLVLSKR